MLVDADILGLGLSVAGFAWVLNSALLGVPLLLPRGPVDSWLASASKKTQHYVAATAPAAPAALAAFTGHTGAASGQLVLVLGGLLLVGLPLIMVMFALGSMRPALPLRVLSILSALMQRVLLQFASRLRKSLHLGYQMGCYNGKLAAAAAPARPPATVPQAAAPASGVELDVQEFTIVHKMDPPAVLWLQLLSWIVMMSVIVGFCIAHIIGYWSGYGTGYCIAYCTGNRAAAATPADPTATRVVVVKHVHQLDARLVAALWRPLQSLSGLTNTFRAQALALVSVLTAATPEALDSAMRSHLGL